MTEAEARSYASVEGALADLKAGRMLVVTDDEDRENEGDVIMAAELITPEAVNFITRHARGLICVPMRGEDLDRLDLNMMVEVNTAPHQTAFTISVDYKVGTTTGISVHDRAATIRALTDPGLNPELLGRPGHIFPLRAAEGGVLRRAGHTEAVVDLMQMAGLKPIGVLCEVLAEDGTMARGADLHRFAEEHGLKILTIKELIAYRYHQEKLVQRIVTTPLPTKYGDFMLHLYISRADGKEHIALVKGDVTTGDPLVRVHSQCLTGDMLGSLRCDCGEQMAAALRRIEAEGRGVFLYMRQEGRGIGLTNKLKAYNLQDQGLDTVEANEALGFAPDPRDYGVGAQILADLGLHRIRLLTNNPRKRVGLESYGIDIVDRVELLVTPNPNNARYLETKRSKLGHLLPDSDTIETLAADLKPADARVTPAKPADARPVDPKPRNA